MACFDHVIILYYCLLYEYYLLTIKCKEEIKFNIITMKRIKACCSIFPTLEFLSVKLHLINIHSKNSIHQNDYHKILARNFSVNLLQLHCNSSCWQIQLIIILKVIPFPLGHSCYFRFGIVVSFFKQKGHFPPLQNVKHPIKFHMITFNDTSQSRRSYTHDFYRVYNIMQCIMHDLQRDIIQIL